MATHFVPESEDPELEFRDASSIQVSAARRRRMWAMTPQQRLERYLAITQSVREHLDANPQALAEFHRRNHRKRKQSNAEILLREMRQL